MSSARMLPSSMLKCVYRQELVESTIDEAVQISTLPQHNGCFEAGRHSRECGFALTYSAAENSCWNGSTLNYDGCNLGCKINFVVGLNGAQDQFGIINVLNEVWFARLQALIAPYQPSTPVSGPDELRPVLWGPASARPREMQGILIHSVDPSAASGPSGVRLHFGC